MFPRKKELSSSYSKSVYYLYKSPKYSPKTKSKGAESPSFTPLSSTYDFSFAHTSTEEYYYLGNKESTGCCQNKCVIL